MVICPTFISIMLFICLFLLKYDKKVIFNEILIADVAQDIALLEGQFLRTYQDAHQWFYHFFAEDTLLNAWSE